MPKFESYKPRAEYSDKAIRPEQGMKHPYPALDSTSEYLNSSGIEEYNLVEVGEYGFNEIPMASFGFKFCDALVLRDPNKRGSKALAHVLSGADPNEYVDKLVKFFGTSNVEAIVIKAGHQPDKLIEACNKKGIRILQTHDIPMRDEHRTYMHDVIVRPELDKVLVNIDELGLREINF